MLIDISVTKEEVVELLREFSPIRIHLTQSDEDRRWIEFETPDEVSFVPDEGLRIRTHGRLRYELLGIGIPGTLRSIQLLLRPKLLRREHGSHALAFDIDIEEGDLSLIPDFIDGAIAQRVNAAITPRITEMMWRFGRTFTYRAPLPSRLEPLDAFFTEVEGARVVIDDHRIRFRVHVRGGFIRSKPRPTDDERVSRVQRAQRRRSQPLDAAALTSR